MMNDLSIMSYHVFHNMFVCAKLSFENVLHVDECRRYIYFLGGQLRYIY